MAGTVPVTSSFRFIASLSATLPSLALAAAFAGVEVPPPPAPRPVTETFWGVAVEDPYRFLENTSDPEIQAFMRGQADATQAILAKIPGREKLAARVKEIDAETPGQVTQIERDENGRVFYLKREAKDNQFKLYMREKPDGADVLLVDPEVEMKATGKPHAIGDFSPSPDGSKLVYSISASGTEIGTLHVIDTATRKEVIPPIDRVRFAAAGWLSDSSGFFHSRLRADYDKAPRAERFLDNVNYLVKLAEPGKEIKAFGPKLFPEVTTDRSASAFVNQLPGTQLVTAFVFHGVDRNRSLYLADLAGVLEGKPKWRKVFDQSAKIDLAAAGGGWLYVKTARDAPRYQVLRTRLPEADLAKAETVVAPSDAVIVGLGAAKDALYVTRREGVVSRLLRIPYGDAVKPQTIAMPFDGTVDLVEANLRREGAVLRLSGWARAAQPYLLGAGDAKPEVLPLVPLGKYDAPGNVVAREVMVKSHDGVEVPVSILSRADIKLDGRNPTIVYGYGAYGMVEEPAWTPRLLAWLEQGGVYAIAHVRGGGILGDAWHMAGHKGTKPNTWKDGIAAAEWLIANKYTSRDRLGIYGGSAGGIFVGRAITERPDLFAAATIAVGNTDQLRSETRANGAGNIPEYGTVKVEEEFKALLANSTYANVKPGTAYPAVLFEHGVNDTRVDVWMTLKTASRLAAATTSGKPVLMRLEYEAGHGVGATREQLQRRTVDRWAFCLWQFGVPGFQPDESVKSN
jgi:prolyl oligopeptidase